MSAAWDLATRGMAIIGERRDTTWATLAWYDALRRDAEDPDDVGMPLLTEERREIMRVLEQSPDSIAAFAARFFSRMYVPVERRWHRRRKYASAGWTIGAARGS